MQIANSQTSGPTKLTNLADRPKCCNFRICYQRTQPFLAICDLFCRLKTSANPLKHNFLLTSIGLKCSNSNSYKQNFTGRILAGFPMKRPTTDLTFEKKVFHPRCPMVKNCGFAICGMEHQKNLRICGCGLTRTNCGFARVFDWHNEHNEPKNVRICDSMIYAHLCQRICDSKTYAHLCPTCCQR
jgi:hypothetical protein